MAKRRHRMTSKRRAALRKAQMASARKRRGSRFAGLKSAARTTGVIAGSIGATFLAYHTNEYIVHPSKFARDTKIGIRNTKSLFGGAARKVTRKAAPTPKAGPPKDWSKFGYL